MGKLKKAPGTGKHNREGILHSIARAPRENFSSRIRDRIFRAKAKILNSIGEHLTNDELFSSLSHLQQIGAGAFGSVYHAEFEQADGSKRAVVLKFLTTSLEFNYADEPATERFMREGRMMIDLCGLPGVATTYSLAKVPKGIRIDGMESSEGALMLIMDHYPNGDLTEGEHNQLSLYAERAMENYYLEEEDDSETLREADKIRSRMAHLFDSDDEDSREEDEEDDEFDSNDSWVQEVDENRAIFGEYMRGDADQDSWQPGNYDYEDPTGYNLDQLEEEGFDLFKEKPTKREGVQVEGLKVINSSAFFEKLKISTEFVDEMEVNTIDGKKLPFGQADSNTMIIKADAERIVEAFRVLSHRALLEAIAKLSMNLEKTHQTKIVHRDIKGPNILIDEHGNLVLGDFGLAKRMTKRPYKDKPLSKTEAEDIEAKAERAVTHYTQLTKKGATVGTPTHTAPELVSEAHLNGDEQYSPASDQYALGVTILKQITGVNPFLAGDAGGIIRALAKYGMLPEEQAQVFVEGWKRRFAHPELAETVVKALSRNPRDRFKNCRAFGKAILDFLEENDPESMLEVYLQSN